MVIFVTFIKQTFLFVYKEYTLPDVIISLAKCGMETGETVLFFLLFFRLVLQPKKRNSVSGVSRIEFKKVLLSLWLLDGLCRRWLLSTVDSAVEIGSRTFLVSLNH